mgnify:CR=1 FL=1
MWIIGKVSEEDHGSTHQKRHSSGVHPAAERAASGQDFHQGHCGKERGEPQYLLLLLQ